MTFVAAVSFLSAVTAAYSLGGNGVPAAAAFALAAIPALGGKSSLFIKLKYPCVALFAASSALKLFALGMRARTELGIFGACVLCAACAAAAVWLALSKNAAYYSATPAFLAVTSLAVLAAAISFGDASPYPLSGNIEPFEIISALLLSLSASASLAVSAKTGPSERVKGCCIAFAVFAVFILFPAADAEYGIVSVPVCVIQLALEFKSLAAIILPEPAE